MKITGRTADNDFEGWRKNEHCFYSLFFLNGENLNMYDPWGCLGMCPSALQLQRTHWLMAPAAVLWNLSMPPCQQHASLGCSPPVESGRGAKEVPPWEIVGPLLALLNFSQNYVLVWDPSPSLLPFLSSSPGLVPAMVWGCSQPLLSPSPFHLAVSFIFSFLFSFFLFFPFFSFPFFSFLFSFFLSLPPSLPTSFLLSFFSLLLPF